MTMHIFLFGAENDLPIWGNRLSVNLVIFHEEKMHINGLTLNVRVYTSLIHTIQARQTIHAEK